VAKLDKNLSQIQATYLGGNSWDYANALAIHSQTGKVYVVGDTYSNDFSGTTGRDTNRTDQDAFVAKLDKDLSQIQATYLGGSDSDSANALAISSTGDVYVAGYTSSSDFPGTSGGAQASCNGCANNYYPYPDAFVARLDKELSLIQATYLGGSDYDGAKALAISGSDVYVVGETNSKNFPKTTGGAQEIKGGCLDAFVARLNKELTQILQATYLGGNDEEHANALAIHPTTGEIYVAGYTASTNFPNTSGGAQPSCNGCDSYYSDAFVARLTADLAASSSSGSGSGSGTGSGGGSGAVGGTGGGSGGCSMTGSTSSMAGLWNIVVWLSVPAFVLVRRIRKK
jgi:hypothetical protein